MKHRFMPVLLTVLFVPAAAAAQNQSIGIYVEARGGAAFLTDSDVDSDDLEDQGFSDIEVEFDTGWLIEGAAGYAHDSGIRGEIALGYRKNDLDEIEADFGSSSVSADVDGDVSMFTALANGYYDFHLDKFGARGALANLTPFVGGGLGIGVTDVDGDTGDGTDTVFAYQAVAGFYYGLTRNIGVTLSYTYFSTSDIEDDDVDAEYDSHNALAGIRYTF